MDYQQFIDRLPTLYDNWGLDSIRPKSRKFQQALDKMRGMASANLMQLLNLAVECLEPDEIYCQIGTADGSTLIGALLERPECMAYAADDFSESNPDGGNLEKLIENLQIFNLEEQVFFCEQDFEEFLLELREVETDNKIGVYFYNGLSDYRSQLLALLLVRPFLAGKALIVTANANSEIVQQAIWDFAAANPECQIELELVNFDSGIQVLSWDTGRSYNYSPSDFLEKRQPSVLQAISKLQQFEGSLDIAGSHLQIAEILFQQGRYEEAIAQYQTYLQLQTVDAGVYGNLSECFWALRREGEAIAILQEGVRLYPTAAPLQFSLIIKLLYSGRTAEAVSSAETASRLLPDDYTFKMLKNLIVPMVYDTPEEIGFYRDRFERGLQNLIQETSLESPEERESAFLGISRLTNFYLAYQAHNVVESQRIYGNLVHKIMAAKYPQWVEPLSMPPVENKIRIGYVSNYLHAYSGTLWLTGWLRYADRDNFELYCYYTGNSPDAVTQLFRNCSDAFYHTPGNLEAVCEQILSDRLHILIYPEIGMDPPTMRMAALRLAPMQCVAWGHPVTSGLSAIDYFLSSELMEPTNAREHYSETLIFLPNIGVAYPQPSDIPPLTKTRADFNLPEEAVIYFCCQAPFKYLPQYDYILAEIARRVPHARFLFLRGNILKHRLARAFAAVGLNSEEYCIHLTIPERSDYLMLNLLSDVFLDTFTWSGGNTSLEAIACNLPVVTCPGEFMRGRHADSFLKMLGVTDTIAENEAEYIEIAVKLGLNPEWRRDISDRMSQRHDSLFDDKTCVSALEAFYKQVVFERL